MSTGCIDQFLDALLLDLGLDFFRRERVEIKLRISLAVYDRNKPTNTLGDIANDLYQCLKPTISDVSKITVQQITSTLFYVLVITAIFVILIVIVSIMLDRTTDYAVILGISILFAIFYIEVVYAVAKNAELNVINNVTQTEATAANCVATAVNSLTKFINAQTNAVNLALCAYTNTGQAPCLCASEAIDVLASSSSSSSSSSPSSLLPCPCIT